MFRKAALVQGSLDLLILQTLTAGPHHGRGLARRIGQVTRGYLRRQAWLTLSGASPNGFRTIVRSTGLRILLRLLE
jgi:hypothetical protein